MFEAADEKETRFERRGEGDAESESSMMMAALGDGHGDASGIADDSGDRSSSCSSTTCSCAACGIVDSHVDMRAFELDPEGPAKDDDEGLETSFARNGATWSSSIGGVSFVMYIVELCESPGSEHLFFPRAFSLSSTGLTVSCQLRNSSGCGADLTLGVRLELAIVSIICVSVMAFSMFSVLRSYESNLRYRGVCEEYCSGGVSINELRTDSEDVERSSLLKSESRG